MAYPPQRLLAEISARRAAVLAEYSDHELHQLRVAVRRLRSRLRNDNHLAARQLRKDWGQLISSSNPARDWDTLAAALSAEPAGSVSQTLRVAVAEQRQAAQEQARHSLLIPQWQQTLDRSQDFFQHNSDSPEQAIIDKARQRVAGAWGDARSSADLRHWHKLRIAIKDLRYSLDAPDGGSSDKEIDWCKLLQTELGDWHDTVVHRELLQALGTEPGSESGRAAIERLLAGMGARGKACLERVRQIIESAGPLARADSARLTEPAVSPVPRE